MPRHDPRCRCCAAVCRLTLPSPGHRLAGSWSLREISEIFKCPPQRKHPELFEGCSSHRSVGPGKDCGMEPWICGVVWTKRHLKDHLVPTQEKLHHLL